MTIFGHPLHPITVHFPIAFYILGVLMTGVCLWRRQSDSEFERFAYWSFILSWAATLLATIFGLIDQSSLNLDDPRRSNVNSHITAGVALFIFNGLLVYMRVRWPDVLTRHRWPYLGVMALGLLAVLATAWLGAELVYRFQVGILQ